MTTQATPVLHETPVGKPARIDSKLPEETFVTESPRFDSARPADETYDRAAVLESLYQQLHTLNRTKRVGGLTSHGEFMLSQVRREIDRWELSEAAEKPSVWDRIDNIAEQVANLYNASPKR